MSHAPTGCDRVILETIAAILIRSFLVSTAALLFVWGLVFTIPEPIHRLQAALTGLTPADAALLTTVFLTFVKCIGVTLFLFPWVAIRLVLRQQSEPD